MSRFYVVQKPMKYLLLNRMLEKQPSWESDVFINDEKTRLLTVHASPTSNAIGTPITTVAMSRETDIKLELSRNTGSPKLTVLTW